MYVRLKPGNSDDSPQWLAESCYVTERRRGLSRWGSKEGILKGRGLVRNGRVELKLKAVDMETTEGRIGELGVWGKVKRIERLGAYILVFSSPRVKLSLDSIYEGYFTFIKLAIWKNKTNKKQCMEKRSYSEKFRKSEVWGNHPAKPGSWEHLGNYVDKVGLTDSTLSIVVFWILKVRTSRCTFVSPVYPKLVGKVLYRPETTGLIPGLGKIRRRK